jgi:hypothetical protein
MFHRPMTLVAIVVVMFVLGGVVRLSTRGGTGSRPADDPAAQIAALTEDYAAAELGTEPLASSTPEDTSAEASNDAPVEAETPRRMLDTIDALEELIEDGRERCAELGEPDYDPEYPGAAGREHSLAWTEFARAWDDDLNDAVERLPAHPGWQVDEALTYAYQDIASAIGQLRIVPLGVGDWSAPFAYQWTERFDSAQRSLESARARLAPGQ